MAEQSLAIKYRPKSFDDLTEQEYIKVILENQIKTNSIKNTYLFTGPAGCGKTTSARIFASMINEGQGNPIEIDAASNNGVEQIRVIIDEAKFKPIDSKYKVYIMDECHMLSIGAWNALLKLLEEPPKTTVFILCTTDPQKIPKTILSRVQRYDFNKISFEGLVERLKYIIFQENIEIGDIITNDVELDNKYGPINYEEDALKFIAKIAEGGMRDAISNLDKVLSLTHQVTVDNVVKALGISDYENLYQLLINILDGETKKSIDIIENIYNSGKDLKLFIKQFIQFVLDVEKYLIYASYDYIQIPNTIDLSIFNIGDDQKLLKLLDIVIELSNQIKYDQNPKVLIESRILLLRW